MINLLFFNPLNLFPPRPSSQDRPLPTSCLPPASCEREEKRGNDTTISREMTSKCFRLQALANYQSPVLGGNPSSAGVNGVTSTAAYNKDQTSVRPVRQPSMKPCYDHGIHETGPRGIMGLWGSGRKPLWLHWPVCSSPPGTHTQANTCKHMRTQTHTHRPPTDVWENCPIHHDTTEESLWTEVTKEVDRPTDRLIDRLINRQTDRPTDREIDRYIHRQIDCSL